VLLSAEGLQPNCARATPNPEVDRSQADSQGTSSVLYGDDLKPKLCGLFPESVLSALYGFFVAAVKGIDTSRSASIRRIAARFASA
jgi:hypothetical protein